MRLPRLFRKRRNETLPDDVETEVVETVPIEPTGRVISHTKPVEYELDTNRRGGRVVRSMPKDLKKMKEAQERLGDD